MLAAPVAYKFALQDYQRERISTFLDPAQDPEGAGYQQIQARITVGSGGVWGKGFMQGTQGQLRFLPVAHNDFIFSVLAEEQGLLGVLVALGLYLFVIMRALDAARLAKDRLGAYLVLGVLVVVHVPGHLQHHHVGGSGAGQGTHAAAHELRRLLHDRDAGQFRPHSQRQDAPLHELAMHATSACAEFAAMNKEMIISSNGHETRVAILEDDQLAEIFVEREQNRGVVGNVYKGRVSKVLPGMQSSFVDIGLERDGFLYVSDVIANLDEYDKDDDEDDGAKGAKGANGANGANGADAVPTVPRRRTAAPPERRGRGRDRRDRDDEERAPEPKIEELLKEGQDVIVQVAKEPLGTKGARLTCHVTLPGRFLVFMPTVDHIGISRKIDSREERSRLRGIVKEFREQHSFSGGVIIRTAASGRSKEDILADLNYFYKIWVDMRQRGEQRALAGHRLPGAEPGREAAARSADRRLLGDPHRQPGRAPARRSSSSAASCRPRQRA